MMTTEARVAAVKERVRQGSSKNATTTSSPAPCWGSAKTRNFRKSAAPRRVTGTPPEHGRRKSLEKEEADGHPDLPGHDIHAAARHGVGGGRRGSYINENGTPQTSSSAEVITKTLTSWGENDDAEHWYVAQGDITIGRHITVTGDVHLILADGSALTASLGIGVSSGSSLTVYAQSTGDEMGTLSADGGADGQTGIGGSGSSVIIHGGIVTATGGDGAAGIDGSVTITGGRVTATGGENAAGIGGGTVTITGGIVTAAGGDGGAGIGGGSGSAGGAITISGGIVTGRGQQRRRGHRRRRRRRRGRHYHQRRHSHGHRRQR